MPIFTRWWTNTKYYVFGLNDVHYLQWMDFSISQKGQNGYWERISIQHVAEKWRRYISPVPQPSELIFVGIKRRWGKLIAMSTDFSTNDLFLSNYLRKGIDFIYSISNLTHMMRFLETFQISGVLFNLTKKYHQKWRQHRAMNCLHCSHCFHRSHWLHCLNRALEQKGCNAYTYDVAS